MARLELSVPGAAASRDFDTGLLGWQAETDEADEFCMRPDAGSAPVAGITAATGDNSRQPEQWLPCFTVDDLHATLQRLRALGDLVVGTVRDGGDCRSSTVRDPDGIFVGLIQVDT